MLDSDWNELDEMDLQMICMVSERIPDLAAGLATESKTTGQVLDEIRLGLTAGDEADRDLASRIETMVEVLRYCGPALSVEKRVMDVLKEIDEQMRKLDEATHAAPRVGTSLAQAEAEKMAVGRATEQKRNDRMMISGLLG